MGHRAQPPPCHARSLREAARRACCADRGVPAPHAAAAWRARLCGGRGPRGTSCCRPTASRPRATLLPAAACARGGPRRRGKAALSSAGYQRVRWPQLNLRGGTLLEGGAGAARQPLEEPHLHRGCPSQHPYRAQAVQTQQRASRCQPVRATCAAIATSARKKPSATVPATRRVRSLPFTLTGRSICHALGKLVQSKHPSKECFGSPARPGAPGCR
jgi:hypothetical protein